MPADLHVPDAPFLDEPTGEAGRGAEQLGDLVDGEMTLSHEWVPLPFRVRA